MKVRRILVMCILSFCFAGCGAKPEQESEIQVEELADEADTTETEAGTETDTEIEVESEALVEAENKTESTEETTIDENAAALYGIWNIKGAKRADNGEDYTLAQLYGTGIQYAGTLTLMEDGTFTRYVGINAESESTEGSYLVEDNKITFQYNNGSSVTALYLPESNQIEYHLVGFADVDINEYYEKY